MKISWDIANITRKAALYSGLILISDAVGLGMDSLILGRNMFHYFTLLTLVEAALLFLIGGALDVGGSLSFTKVMNYVGKTNTIWSADGHRRAQSKAAPIIVAGIFFLALSFALAYPLN